MEYIFDLDELTPRRRGRPRLLGPDGYLGLVLFYMGSTMTNKHLCLIFGTMYLGRELNDLYDNHDDDEDDDE